MMSCSAGFALTLPSISCVPPTGFPYHRRVTLTHRRQLLKLAALTLSCCIGSQIAIGAPDSPEFAATARFQREFGASFLDHYWRLHPDLAIPLGYYQVANLLRVPNEAYRAEDLAFLRSSLAKLRAIPPAALDISARADAAVLENQLKSELWSLTEYRDFEWDPSSYTVAEAFALLLNTEYAPLDQRLRAVLARLGAVPAYYAAAERNIKNPTRERTQLAIEQSGGALEVFGADLEHKINASTLRDSERLLLRQRVVAARAAIQGYIDWLKAEDQQLASGTPRSFRLGRALYEPKFAFDIASGSTAEALYQRAMVEKESLLTRMDLLSDELWPKYFPNTARPQNRLDKIGTLIDKLSEQHIARGDLFSEIKRQIPVLERWVTDHQLITLDPRKPLEVRITPKYKQGVAGASLDSPGPYDPDARSYFNVTPLDDLSPERAESSLREYNRWMLPILVIHEAIPGHYVQFIYSNKSPSLIKSLFTNDAMAEGWAVYGERMMLESGFGDDSAEEWLIYSKWNLRSVCNTILDYGVHVLNMSESDARQLLVHQAFQSEEEVHEKWHRVTVTAVQLTSYFAGYSAIYDFRERLKREQGAKFDLKRFHEQFLSYGSASVQIIEQIMLEQPP
jgi:uncharacterized protein (DUF885 family)